MLGALSGFGLILGCHAQEGGVIEAASPARRCKQCGASCGGMSRLPQERRQ
jgi:hypothetical protein